MNYRQGNINDLNLLQSLAIKSWGQFESELTIENWQRLKISLLADETFLGLLEHSYCLVCENDKKEIIGMSFLVPHGNPTEIYDEKWCYIRFVSVDPEFGGQGIGRQLTEKCIQFAIDNKEHTIALHTSEMMNNARHIYESLGFKILKELAQGLAKNIGFIRLTLLKREFLLKKNVTNKKQQAAISSGLFDKASMQIIKEKTFLKLLN